MCELTIIFVIMDLSFYGYITLTNYLLKTINNNNNNNNNKSSNYVISPSMNVLLFVE
jgi:hypothetical protein